VLVEAEPQRDSAADLDAAPRLPLFSGAQMRRTEWKALFNALEAARATYLRELVAWRNRQPRTQGALAQASHDLEVAKRRLQRFERGMCAGHTADLTPRGGPITKVPRRSAEFTSAG
jgi:hypothetical protein